MIGGQSRVMDASTNKRTDYGPGLLSTGLAYR